MPRLPGKLGSYCALTGERVKAADGVAAGVATHRVPSARFADLIEALCRGDPVEVVLSAYAQDVGRGPLAARSTVIAALFAGERVEDILAALDTAAAAGGADAAFASAKAAQRSLAESMARSLGPFGIHVALVVIDGVIDAPQARKALPDKPDDFFLKPEDIAETVYFLTQQKKSAWTFELEVRPFGENW